MSLTKVSYSMITGTPVNVLDYGAVGNGVANDYAAIVAARDAARSSGNALYFPQGTYAFATTIDFGADFEEVIFDNGVILKYTGSGNYGITFDAGPNPSDLSYGGSFGWGCPPLIQASNSQSAAVFVRSWHHGRLDIRCNAALSSVLRIDYAVCSEFRTVASVNHGPWVTQPVTGVQINKRNPGEYTTDSTFYNLVIEGVSGDGIVSNGAQYCLFIGGTTEGNGGAGYSEGPEAINNILNNIFCEQNGSSDFYLDGQAGFLYNCTANTYGGGISINGPRYTIIGGEGRNVTISAASSDTVFDGFKRYNTDNGGSITDLGIGTRYNNAILQTSNSYISLPNVAQKPKQKRIGQMAISEASQAAKCILRINNHNLDVGDSISIASVGGMTQLNGNTYTVEPLDANLVYILSGGSYVNSTGYGAYTSGGQATFVAFQNSWLNYSGTYRDAVFSKSADGYVTFGGVVTAGSVGTIMFTLPDGYKPSADCMFAIANSGSAASVGTVQVKADGKVYFVTGTDASPTAFVSLDNVRFLTV